MDGFFYYFAYGSNMLTARLQAPSRCKSAEPVGVAEAKDFSVAFNKPSKDGSGKAALTSKIGSRAYGVVFKIHDTELPALDRAEGEGRGYKRCDKFSVRLTNAERLLDLKTYLATETDSAREPYDWYLALVIAGAREHNIANEYLKGLYEIPYCVDECLNRPERKEAIEALEKSGYSDFRVVLSTPAI